MPVHKLYIDSRAAIEPSIDPSHFTWAPLRPVHIGKSRAWIDSVHMYSSWGTITTHNQSVYVAEELPLLTVLSSARKVYLSEQSVSNGPVTERVVNLTPAIYDGPGLAAHLASALTAGAATYSASYTAVPGTQGTIALSVTGITAFSISSRASLLSLGTWASATLSKSQLEDASDVLGTVTTTVAGASVTLTLGHGRAYRKVQLSIGSYSFDSLRAEMQSQLNAGTQLGAATYTVSSNPATGTLTITNSASPLRFHLYPGSYLEANPYAFQGFTAPFASSDEVTGFTGATVLAGNSATGAVHVNCQAYGTLFISSSLGGHNDSIGPLSQSTIARKVTCSGPTGSAIDDFHSLPYDYLSLEPQSISGITFRVTDWAGRTVPMSHWSLSIIIVPESEF